VIEMTRYRTKMELEFLRANYGVSEGSSYYF
jgi:hypothetical protein